MYLVSLHTYLHITPYILGNNSCKCDLKYAILFKISNNMHFFPLLLTEVSENPQKQRSQIDDSEKLK